MRLSVRAGTIRLLSVTAVAATACALTVGAASAATAKAAPKHATKTKVSVAKSAYVGASVKLSATVTGAGSRPTGTVVFWFGSRKLCHGTLSKGSTHCDTSFSNPASKTITAKYGGNSTHKASSGTGHVNVVRSASTTKINNTSPTNVDSGSKFTFNVTVSGPTGTPYATGNVVIAPTAPAGLPASFSCTATLSRGHGSCTITTSDYGVIDYAATYSGSAAHTGSTYVGPFELGVQNVTSTSITAVTTTAGDVQLNANVYSQGANVDSDNGGTGTVAFYVSDTSGGTGTVVADCAAQLLTSFSGEPNFYNVATCGPANGTLNGLKAGTTYYVTAVFSGDPVNVGSTSKQFVLTPTP
jgi:hypothetical protein